MVLRVHHWMNFLKLPCDKKKTLQRCISQKHLPNLVHGAAGLLHTVTQYAAAVCWVCITAHYSRSLTHLWEPRRVPVTTAHGFCWVWQVWWGCSAGSICDSRGHCEMPTKFIVIYKQKRLHKREELSVIASKGTFPTAMDYRESSGKVSCS